MARWQDALATLCRRADAVDETAVRSGIDRIEGMFGIALPESYLAFVKRVPALRPRAFGDFEVLTLEQALVVLGQVARTIEDFDEGDADEVDADLASHADERIRRVMWTGKRIPFAGFNGDAWLCLDFSPSASGTAGQVILLDPEALGWSWIAPNFETLLVEVAAGRELDEEFL